MMSAKAKGSGKRRARTEVIIQLYEWWGYHTALRPEYEGRGTVKPDRDLEESELLIRKIKNAARKKGAHVTEESHSSNPLDRSDSLGRRPPRHFSGGFTTDIVTNITLAFGAAGGAAALLKLARAALIQWMKNMSNRSITVKIDGREVRIEGTNDVEKAISVLKALEDTKA